jgi:hypothetical protein
MERHDQTKHQATRVQLAIFNRLCKCGGLELSVRMYLAISRTESSPRRFEVIHDLQRPLGQHADEFHNPHDRVGNEYPAPGSPRDSDHIPGGLSLPSP